MCHEITRSYLFVARTALLSRLATLLFMCLSHATLPNFDPGDDVARFPLDAPTVAAAAAPAPHPWRDNIYTFLLPPVTRWDAARFLTLAMDPTARDPRPPSRVVDNGEEVLKDDDTCSAAVPSSSSDGDSFRVSEEAHAFFPLLPFLVRCLTRTLINAMPTVLLPPSVAATAALAGILLNIVSFVLAALMLHNLSLAILRRPRRRPVVTASSLLMAETASLLFCLNPAGVFFTSVYSESLFSALLFGGGACAVRGRDIPAVALWMMAGYVRSNGTVSVLYLLLRGVSRLVAANDERGEGGSGGALWRGRIGSFLYYCVLGCTVAVPFRYHDMAGYARHCHDGSSSRRGWCQPEWCGSVSSLYSYVQRKHWNVGFLRYYRPAQIPNFVLAAPVLILGTAAAWEWIRLSWKRFRKLCDDDGGDRTGNDGADTGWRVVNVVCWALHALREWDCDFRGEAATEEGEEDMVRTPSLIGPCTLPYYAILMFVCFVGATVAHVQISTRMICSTCPAFYWYLSTVLCRHGDSGKEEEGEKSAWGLIFSNGVGSRKWIKWYFVGYNVLGVVMHVNWLPWT